MFVPFSYNADDVASRYRRCQIGHYTSCSAWQMFTAEQMNYMQESTYQ